ncbi:DUF6445 family protein [Janthinobacterium agaricidamnosum]|uniref:Tetratricopeptide repeat family protein n=1 Tax=Janthinobacterium agaricidamnosum NBRC 102515 = DSM 9628 TaxID=1349767 RepID=W0VCS9_9BURK|nr:DUF6445 family protein [Janthinobacterium agaricidamnosum]CDG85726.1 tetratricopeptide repeat family protein [Janthinobacterium agaricidamnosum NBRC 102515 = DSM 9628]
MDAINAYQAACKLAPELVEAQHFQGLAMLQLGQRAIGLGLLKLSIKQAPGNGTFHFNLGNALRDSDPATALLSFQRAAQLVPDDHDFAIVHAETLLQLKHLPESIAELERAHVLRPQRWQNLQGLAQLYYRTGQLALARQRYRQGLALHPQLGQHCRIAYARPDAGTPEKTRILSLAEVPQTALADQAALQAFSEEIGLAIIDDFLPDPAAYRAAALDLHYHQQRYAGQNYPGQQTEGTDCESIMQRIANALGRTVKCMSPDNGSYRISYADAVARTDIHVDNESGDNFNVYAGVLYLNPPEQCQGGTTFWRHKPSGWQRRPPESEVKQAGYPSFKDFQKKWLPNAQVQKFNDLQQQRDAWQALVEIPMRHNRLIVYRGHHFHSISNVFGNTPDNGRLVQLFFFEVEP